MTNTTLPASVRKPWLRPAVQKIAAGQAESSTRGNRQDGDFQTS